MLKKIWICSQLLWSVVALADVKTEELLKEADRSRGAAASLEGVTWNVDVESVEDKNTSEQSYLVKAKGNLALAEVVAPKRSAGERILLNDRNMWFSKPNLKKPVPISARQKLMGQAANGDIASTNYARDYEGTIEGEEKVDDVLSYKCELKAKAKNVTYEKIRYWISKDRKLGVKAEFLTVSGQVFKTARFEYKNTIVVKGKTFPFISKMIIVDATKKNLVTTMTYKDSKIENHPDSMFNVNNLLR